jgi:hypothetical protein
VLLAATMIVASAFTSCRTSGHEYWSFPLSRAVYTGMTFEKTQASFSHSQSTSGNAQGLAMVAVICLPFVLDVVILPVTGARDAYVAITH